MVINTHIVQTSTVRKRFVDYACGLFPELPSRNSVKKAIKRGELLLNGERAEFGRWLQLGDKLEVLDLELKPPKPFEMDIEVVYEDDYFAVVNKPAGIPVNGNKFRTVENALQDIIKVSPLPDALKWAKPIHRLDSPTSGLLLVSKTKGAHMQIGQQFERREVQKTYHAVVLGKMRESGRIEATIEGQAALTDYKLLKTSPALISDEVSLVELYPKTGRTHQLRIHLSGLGHAIVGDKQYGEEGKVYKEKGLFLAAVALSFVHPFTGEKMKVELKTPHKFESLLLREERRWTKYNDGKNSE